MVVGLALAAVQMGMALPTGFLFGVGYGTGVRIGYEQVYPLLFPKGARPTTTELAATMKGMNTVYDAIGGKDASRMGIAVGITNAGDILNNPDFQVLEQLELSSSGPTSSNSNRSRYGADNISPLPDSSSDVTGLDTSYFQSYYQAIQSFNLTQTISAYGSAQNYKNGFSIKQNDEFIIPALRTRLALLRSSAESTTPNTTPVETNLPPASFREATTQEQNYNIWRAELTRLQLRYRTQKTKISQLQNQLQIHTRANKLELIASTSKILKIHQNGLISTIKAIRAMSNDYRSPNNTIRKFALSLRQQMANGNWT